MRYVRVENVDRGRELGTRIGMADRWWLRLRGLLGRPRIRDGEGMLLLGSPAIHTVGMRYPLDIAVLDRTGRIIAVYAALPPGRRTRLHAAAAHTLELPAGALDRTGTREHDRLVWHPVADDA
ncbi:MAG TPA: DUF192 domain-containing protein [Longimicrobiales bacterium]